jgi:mRNA interferase MazF
MKTVRQGEVYWLNFGIPSGSASGYRHPYIVIQNNLFNDSRINTVVVCGITSNLRRGQATGNVVLEKGEAGLPERSVVNVSQIFTVDKRELIERIGAVSPKRMRQILDGIRLLTEPREL